jgi:four helix bundle protein
MEKLGEGFENLLVWQKAHALMLFIHQQVVPCLPPDEKWDLADQVRRSSKSSPSNIAEGHGRFYYREQVRFCYNSRGSLSETENHLITAKDLNYINLDLYQKGRDMAAEIHRLLNGYVNYLKQHKPGKDEPGNDINLD